MAKNGLSGTWTTANGAGPHPTVLVRFINSAAPDSSPRPDDPAPEGVLGGEVPD